MIFLDSNIIIGYLHGDEAIVSELTVRQVDRQALFVSSITVTEVLALSSLSEKDIRVIEKFLDSFIVVQPDKHIAVLAARLRRQHALELPDALIAASAIAHGIPLATRDKKLLRTTQIDTLSF